MEEIENGANMARLIVVNKTHILNEFNKPHEKLQERIETVTLMYKLGRDSVPNWKYFIGYTWLPKRCSLQLYLQFKFVSIS